MDPPSKASRRGRSLKYSTNKGCRSLVRASFTEGGEEGCAKSRFLRYIASLFRPDF